MQNISPATLLRLLSQEIETPALIFDLKGIERRMQRMTRLGRKFNASFLMPVKSFPRPEVLSLAARNLSGFDVSNPSEYKLLGKTKDSSWIWVTNPALKSAVRDGDFGPGKKRVFVCDRLSQLRFVTGSRQTTRVALRLNSDSLLTPSRIKSRFGFSMGSVDAVKEVQDAVHELGSRFSGFHVHHGWLSNKIPDYTQIARAVMRLEKSLQTEVELLNLGGGLRSFEEADIAKLLLKLRRIVPRRIRLFFEPGIFLSAPFGYAVGSVISHSRRGARASVLLDLSSTCHLNWSTPLLLAKSPAKGKKAIRLELEGPTCQEQDRIGSVTVSECPENQVVFSGINGYSVAWNRGFNGIPAARVEFIY